MPPSTPYWTRWGRRLDPALSPLGATVSILAVTDTATCAPCVMLQPDLDALKAAGVPVTYLSGSDPTASSKWGVSATPTLIMLVNGVEPAGGTMQPIRGSWDSSQSWTPRASQ